MRGLILAAMPALLLMGCSCTSTDLLGNTDARTDPATPGIWCFEPPDGATITTADDVHPDTPGIEIEIRCEVTGSYVCEIAMMTIEDELGHSRTYTIPAEDLDVIEFGPVSLDSSAYTFQVVCDPGEVESNIVHINVEDDPAPCLEFIDPVDSEVWTTGDDSDGDSAGFQHDVIVDTTVDAGLPISLEVSGVPVTPSTTIGGSRVVFPDVTFPYGHSVMLHVTAASCSEAITIRIEETAP